MNPIDPSQWVVPAYVAFGLVISQLFIYGKKVKRRVRVTGAELLGDAMQFGVRMVITLATIKGMEIVVRRPITDLWQVVATTILICTSFDTYFIKIREIALTRVIGAAGVLFGRLPGDAMVELPSSDPNKGGGPMKVTTVRGIDKLGDRDIKAGIPFRKAFLPSGTDHEDEQGIVNLLGKLDEEE